MLKNMKNATWWALGAVAMALVVVTPASAKVVGETIVFGAALSFSGKYSTNGKHTKNGYELAKERLNGMGGVNVGGKLDTIAIK